MNEPFRTRRFKPIAPHERPHRRRAAVRIVVTDGRRVLMFMDTDPGIPGSKWWLTPGGGIDVGESQIEAAARELAEETGLTVAPTQLRGPIMERTVVHGFSDQVLIQTESFYALQHPVFEVDTSGHTEDEQVTLKGHAWLDIADLGVQPIPIWPANLPELIDVMNRPDRWPWRVGMVEESTLDADYR